MPSVAVTSVSPESASEALTEDPSYVLAGPSTIAHDEVQSEEENEYLPVMPDAQDAVGDGVEQEDDLYEVTDEEARTKHNR